MEPDRFPPSWPPDEPSRWSLILPKDIAAVRTARSAVDGWLEHAPPEVRAAARSVVTELISNAVRYGQPPIELRVERNAHDWRIDVADRGARRPRFRPAGADAGWGLRIVGGLAEDWGLAEDASRVWCRLRAEPDRGSAPVA